ncbi:MAG: TolC family protein [Bacteroidetes bacterium]|nr:TolC family protein [Bacteroidota bacterium]
MKLNKKLTFLFMAVTFLANAQEIKLPIDSAIKIALEKNYDVLIYSNLTEIEKNNNTIGNAGMLPNIDLSGTYIKSNNDLKQELSNGTNVDKKGVASTNTNLDAGLNWTLFDGMRMFHTKKKLDGFFYQSEQQLKLQMETTISNVIDAYYTIIRDQQLLKAIQQQIILLKERMQLSERKLNNGSGSKLDLLQAKVEFNRQKSIELVTLSDIDEAKLRLNYLLARPMDTPFITEDTVIISFRPSYDELKKSLPDNNNIRLYEMNRKLAELSLKENQSLRYPTITFMSHYIFNRSENGAGFTLLNQSKGLNFGVSASVPIFNGFNINRQIKNSKLDVLNSKLQFTQVNEQINAELANAFRKFSNCLEILSTEEENILLAREMLLIAQERYRVGISNSIELQDSYRSFEESMLRLVEARFKAKTLETDLRRISGRLISSYN